MDKYPVKRVEMKTKWIIIIIILAVLIGLRLYLPVYLEDLANKKLDQLEGYTGTVEDIDLHLYRGAYVIDSVSILKTGDSIPVPFMASEKVDISVQWDALFKGRIVAKIVLTNPHLNFAVAPGKDEKVKQTGKGVKWLEEFRSFSPLKMNKIEVINGKVSYRDITTKPKVDVKIDSLHILIKNLSNVQKVTDSLPSSIDASGIVMESGSFDLNAKVDILKEVPDVDLNFKIEGVPLVEFNDFLRVYSNTNAEAGVFNLYAEALVNDGAIDGYVKPVIDNAKIINWDQENEELTDKLWETLVAGVAEIFENEKKERIATKMPFTGTLEQTDAGIWIGVWETISNAFFEALEKELDYSIDYGE